MLKKLLEFVVGVTVGSSVCFIAVMTFIVLVSPSLGSDRMVEIYVAGLSVIVACYVAWSAASSVKYDNIAIDTLKNDESSLRFGVQDLRRRSRRCKITSVFVLVLMVAVALMGFTVNARQPFDENSQAGPLVSLVLLVIIIRVLASTYRYYLRLSSFYDARADYLYLAGSVKALSHKELLELVGTDELDTTLIRELRRSLFSRLFFHKTKDTKSSSP